MPLELAPEPDSGSCPLENECICDGCETLRAFGIAFVSSSCSSSRLCLDCFRCFDELFERRVVRLSKEPSSGVLGWELFPDLNSPASRDAPFSGGLGGAILAGAGVPFIGVSASSAILAFSGLWLPRAHDGICSLEVSVIFVSSSSAFSLDSSVAGKKTQNLLPVTSLLIVLDALLPLPFEKLGGAREEISLDVLSLSDAKSLTNILLFCHEMPREPTDWQCFLIFS